jgi:hypothetical protein
MQYTYINIHNIHKHHIGIHTQHLCIQIDEDWYLGYHPTWTQKAQGGICYDSADHLEDYIGPWRASQGVDSYICKIGKVKMEP